jgi:hypothetical protein
MRAQLSSFVTSFFQKNMKKFLFNEIKNCLSLKASWYFQYTEARSTLSDIKTNGVFVFFDNISETAVDHRYDRALLASDIDILTPEVEIFDEIDSSWEDYTSIELASLPPERSERCRDFRSKIESGIHFPRMVFESALSLKVLNSQYRKLSRVLHPDRNENSKESEILFKILTKARDLVEIELTNGEKDNQSSTSSAYAVECYKAFSKRICRFFNT